MASKPRPSLLDLFDPLLADAVRVPIPDSPPITPQKPRERGVENKENLIPNELTMSVFFNRISRKTSFPAMKATNLSSGPLVDLDDAEVWLGDDRTQASPRVPLTELSVDDFPLPSNCSLNYGSSYQKLISQSRSSLTGTMPLPPSPLHQTQLASSPPPAISENSSCHLEGSITVETHSPVESVLPQIFEPQKEGPQILPEGLLFPENQGNSGKLFRRRSSVDISATLSSFSSGSFHMPEASFDLVNGEISFLTKSSEELDVNHDVQADLWEPQTPRASLPPQILSPEESPLDLSRTNEHPSDDILLTATSIHPLIGHADISSDSQLVHGEPPFPSGYTETIRDEPLPTPALSTIKTGGQDTPPITRRVSSVPAPIKKLRVFTSKQHQSANTCAKRRTAGMVATSSEISYPTSKISLQESVVGCGTNCIPGIPRGNAAKGAVVGDTVERYKGKSVTSGVKTSTRAPSRAARSIEVSAAEPLSRASAVSRLPGPTGVRGGVFVSQRRHGQPELTRRGRSIPVRSTLRPPSKETSRVTEH